MNLNTSHYDEAERLAGETATLLNGLSNETSKLGSPSYQSAVATAQTLALLAQVHATLATVQL